VAAEQREEETAANQRQPRGRLWHRSRCKCEIASAVEREGAKILGVGAIGIVAGRDIFEKV
jgi:hypothetical protein